MLQDVPVPQMPMRSPWLQVRSFLCYIKCIRANSFHAETIPSFGFDASAAQLPVAPSSGPGKDTAASRLASSLDSKVSDDSGAWLSCCVHSVSQLPLLSLHWLMRIQNLLAPDVNEKSVPKRTRTALAVHRDQATPIQPCPHAAAVWPA